MSSPSPTPPVLIVTGTTASGKNALGASLAVRLGGEVISLDSMKIYRGMNVGTAKPAESERLGVRHHLIDVLEPSESMNLRTFVDLAENIRLDIASRGLVPVIVGGTMMYLLGFLRGVFHGPSADPALRAQLREEAARGGVPALHARLAVFDPAAAARIHPNDYRRLERALEVHAKTGRAITELQREGTIAATFERRIHVVTFERALLDARIDRRVVEMMDEGFVEEVRRIEQGSGFSRESGSALGYPEVRQHLAGRATKEETIERIQQKTRKFARRQLTWLRKLEGAIWHEMRAGSELRTVEDAIASDYEAARSGAPGADAPGAARA
jgi:tRNA dimethylallyltransferase